MISGMPLQNKVNILMNTMSTIAIAHVLSEGQSVDEQVGRLNGV